MAVEKLLSAKFAKIKLRQEAPQSIFSGWVDTFYPPIFGCLRRKGSFSTPTGDYTQNPAASGRRFDVVANDTQLIFAQTVQLIQVDTPFPHEVSQHQEKHGIFEFVPGVDLFPTLGQMALKFPQLVWLFDPRCHLLRFLDGCFQLPMQSAIEGSTRNGLLFR